MTESVLYDLYIYTCFAHSCSKGMPERTLSSPNILDALMTLILCELINTFESDLSREPQRSRSKTLTSILRYIEKNYTDCTLESTAKYFNMHPNYLSAYLKNHTGFTFKQTLQTYRLQQAVHLLKNTSLSVSDISGHVGYLNTNFFFQKFKEKYGCTPGEYRQALK